MNSFQGLQGFNPAYGLALGGLYLLSKSVFLVSAGENAILYNYLTRNFSNKPLREGYHIRIPLITKPIIYETRTRFIEESADTNNRDLQRVNFTIRVLYKPDPQFLVEITRELGSKYAEKLMAPILREVSKTIIAQYDAQSLLSQREQVSANVKAALKERLYNFHVLIDEVTITKTGFSREYEKSIEEKQIAQQTAERMKYIVQKAKQIKQGTIISAEAEVESIRLIGQAVKSNPAYLTLQKIDASKNIAKLISQSNNNFLLDSKMLLLNNLKVSDE